jgi:hypothetical protein
MKKELRNSNDEVYFTVEADKENGWLKGCWYGAVSIEQVKSAGLLYVDALQRNPYSKILNDARHYIGSFLDANEWLERVCFPPAVQAGLTCLASLIPEGHEGRLAAEDLGRRARPNFRVYIYDNEEEAMQWLKNCR